MEVQEELSDSEIEEFLRESDELWQAEIQGDLKEVEQCYCGIPSSSQEVIKCDNPTCSRQWFHLECVGLSDVLPPDTEWFCCLACNEQAATTSTISNPSTSSKTSNVPPPSTSSLRAEQPGSSRPTSSAGASGKSRILKGKPTYPELKKLDEADVISHGREYFAASLEDFKSSPLLKLKTPLAIGVNNLISRLEETLTAEDLGHFVENMMSLLWEIAQTVRGKRWTEDLKCKMWQDFHVLRCNQVLRQQWSDLLSKLQISRQGEEETMLLQHVLEIVFQSVLLLVMNTDMPPKEVRVVPQKMNPHEEKALRYASGYVPYKLRKRFQKMEGNPVALLYVQVLESWGNFEGTGDSFLDYTSEWMKLQNRGGLFNINDDAYLFFKSVETILRSVLQMKNMAYLQSVDIQKVLFTKLLVEKTVNLSWVKVTSKLSPNLSQRLLEEVLKTFLKMRCEAFIKVYLMIRKRAEETISRKGEKSLRKDLQK